MSKKTSRAKRVSPNNDVQIHTDLLNTSRTKNLAIAAMGERKHYLIAPVQTLCDPNIDPSCLMAVDLGGGGVVGAVSSPPPPAQAPAQSAPSTCPGPASMVVGPSQTSGQTFIQNFTIGPNVWVGYTFQVGVYSYTVQIVALSGDTPNSIAQRLANAVNNTSLATWKQSGSDNLNFKPTATANGNTVTTVVDAQHSFYGDAYGVCPAQQPQITPAPPAPAYTPAPSVSPTASVAPINDITLPVNSVVLDGSGSQANNSGSNLTYLWSQVGSNPATADDVNARQTTLRGLVQGSYTIRLTVTDSVTGQTAQKDVSFSVNAAPQIGLPNVVIAPVADITLPQNTIALDGSASRSANGSPLQYLWTKSLGGNATADNDKAAQTELTGLEAGVYSIRLTVTDSTGNSAYKEISFSVNPATAVTLENPPFSSGYMGMPMGGGNNSGDPAAGAPLAAAPQRNWIWAVLVAAAVGYAIFSKEGGKAAPLPTA
jgi:hypothetical protein